MGRNENRKAGRPIEKENRVKVGLSIDGETNDLLNELASNSGKTKSRVFEEAIKALKKQEDITKKRIELFEELGDDALLNFEELMKNRKAIQNEEEVKDVG